MKIIRQKEIWFAQFPLEEDESKKISRPVLVIDNGKDECLVVKITTHKPRDKDKFDLDIKQWEEASLDFPSTARISKLRLLPKTDFIKKIGTIQNKDWIAIEEKLNEL